VQHGDRRAGRKHRLPGGEGSHRGANLEVMVVVVVVVTEATAVAAAVWMRRRGQSGAHPPAAPSRTRCRDEKARKLKQGSRVVRAVYGTACRIVLCPPPRRKEDTLCAGTAHACWALRRRSGQCWAVCCDPHLHPP
jgi:hypothetical protein